MNLRLFSIAMLISALPLVASAGASAISLNSGDFVSAKKISRNGETLVSVKLSKSGKAKFKKLNESSAEKDGNTGEAGVQTVHSEIAGVSTDFKLREPIKGNALEMGPYSPTDAEKVIIEVNKK